MTQGLQGYIRPHCIQWGAAEPASLMLILSSNLLL
jgi:hypothetical protein